MKATPDLQKSRARGECDSKYQQTFKCVLGQLPVQRLAQPTNGAFGPNSNRATISNQIIDIYKGTMKSLLENFGVITGEPAELLDRAAS